MDGGDVCEAEGHFLIGITRRTNEEGARQLAGLLADIGFPSSVIDIRGSRRLLPPKTGLSYLDDGRMLVTTDVPRTAALAPYELIEVPDAERYAANSLCLNDKVLIADGYPQTRSAIETCGYESCRSRCRNTARWTGGSAACRCGSEDQWRFFAADSPFLAFAGPMT